MKYINNPDVFINEDATIKEAMEKLNRVSIKNIYVIDFQDRLVGSLSDGDIRRGLLKGCILESKLDFIINRRPRFLYCNDININEKVKNIMLTTGVESIPILDKDNKVVKVVFWIDLFKEEVKYNFRYERKSNKVFILAGGLGTRLKPFTNILPKSLIPINEKPIIEDIMDRFSRFGFENFILSLNYKSDMIKMYFNDEKVREKYETIQYLKENRPMGTIGSLYLAKDYLEKTFFISNSDIIVDENYEKILEYHKEKKAIITIVGCIKKTIIPYGVLNIDENNNLIDINEKPSYNHIINTGLYVAEPDIIHYLKANHKMDMNELIDKLIKNNNKISIYQIREDQWFDVGQWEEYERTKKILGFI